MPTKTRKKKTKKSKSKPVVEKVVEKVVEEVVKVPVVTRTRRVVTRESVQNGFDLLVADIATEVENIKNTNTTVKRGKTGVRFLKHVSTRLKVLGKDFNRVVKKKKPSTRTNTNSGFMKPVEISSEMRKFTGWNEEPKSRVQVT